jgi:hypothetical protein
VRALLASLRSLVFGETWAIPLGVAVSVAAALALRDVLPEHVWASAGGFFLAALVALTLVVALRAR